MRERGIAPAARRPRAQHLSRGLDRPADRDEPLGVRVEDPPRPVRRRRCARDEVRRRDRLRLDQRLLLRASAAAVSVVGRRRARRPPAAARRSAASRRPRARATASRLRRTRSGTPRRGRRRGGIGRAASARERRRRPRPPRPAPRSRESNPRAVPDDRVAAVVQPVVGELDGHPRAPRGRAVVSQREPHGPVVAGPEPRQVVGEPPDRERADRDGVLADPLHGAG